MASLFDLQRHRRKVYGKMLKTDLQQRRAQQKREREELQRRDSFQLDQHIQNTRKFDEFKRRETRDVNQSLKEDNIILTTLKKNASFSIPSDHSPDFVTQIHELDGKRIAKLRADQQQQFSQNKDFTSGKRGLESQLRQLERTEAERHDARVRQQQMESVRSYQEIKRKHQQDMTLFDRHRKLVEINDSHRDQVESFTQQPVGGGLLERYQRNEYMQRRASLRDNQEQVVRQMEELDRRRSQQVIENRQRPSPLEDSMLASVLLKPQRYEPRAYSNDLRNQMERDSLRRLEEERQKREKVEFGGVFGGVHGGERHRMMQIIDKRLGIDRYLQEKVEGQRRNDPPEGSSPKYP